VATLHRNRVSVGAVVLLALTAIAVVIAALLVSDVGSVYLDWFHSTWNSFASWVMGLLR
jgi:uncharacterized membrane-anchored protein